MGGIDLGPLHKFVVGLLELGGTVGHMEEPLTENLCNEDVLPSLNRKTLSYGGTPSFVLLRFRFPY